MADLSGDLGVISPRNGDFMPETQGGLGFFWEVKPRKDTKNHGFIWLFDEK